jgi:putative phage-type endonuclease
MSAAINTAAMSREDWLRERRRGIGGSEAAAILGLSPWATPLDVYLDKIGEGEDVEETEAMYFGTILEGVVADEFSRRTGLKVRRRNALLTHPDYPWMIANIDRMVVGGGLLECKTCNAFNPWNGVVPEHYQIQVQHYRFTPTCVGQMIVGDDDGCSRAVHPHVRGADLGGDTKGEGSDGSPPRAWGRCGFHQIHSLVPRFTPTCVGQMEQ